MASIKIIFQKYKQLIPFFLPSKKIDFWILEKFLFPKYVPRKETYAICIGGMYGEKDLLKKFHLKFYNIKKINVAACNILPIYLAHAYNYDIILTGKKGDASKKLMWDEAKDIFKISKFDLVYIRFPDLFEKNNWEGVLDFALENITPNGAVFILVRQADLNNLSRFIKNINHKPKLIKKTGITFFGKQSSTFHTVIIF